MASGGTGIDRVIEVDIAANGVLDAELLRPGGEAVIYGSGAPEFSLPFFPLIARNLTCTSSSCTTWATTTAPLHRTRSPGLLREQCLTHNIAERLPRSQIATAHEFVESGRVVGNVILSIP